MIAIRRNQDPRKFIPFKVCPTWTIRNTFNINDKNNLFRYFIKISYKNENLIKKYHIGKKIYQTIINRKNYTNHNIIIFYPGESQLHKKADIHYRTKFRRTKLKKRWPFDEKFVRHQKITRQNFCPDYLETTWGKTPTGQKWRNLWDVRKISSENKMCDEIMFDTAS